MAGLASPPHSLFSGSQSPGQDDRHIKSQTSLWLWGTNGEGAGGTMEPPLALWSFLGLQLYLEMSLEDE